ncbi:MAG: cation transporter [Thermoplasmatales archaeon]|nr:cation transporter [Thermoplasmatales archaeon]MCK4995554.1 cation transporter [Thermoplasmatales archaeon]MCK5635898.1 cation transporter [Thermoplasmatales archaeon]
MGENLDFVKNADRLAGITTITLVGLGILQIILGETVSKSVALTANGIDCIGDGFVSAVVWIGLKFFKKPADHKFHFGYFKMENLASIGAAIVMIGLAIYITFRSYMQYIDPHPVELPLVGAVVAFIAAVIAIGLGVYKYIKGKGTKMGSIKLDAFNTVKDGVASGLTVVALLLASAGYYVADAIVGFIIAGIIVIIGFTAIKESSYTLVDACDGYCLLQGSDVKKIAESVKGVKSAHVVRLRRSGPVAQGEIEIKVDGKMSVKELDEIRKKIQNLAMEKYPDIERLTVTAIPS